MKKISLLAIILLIIASCSSSKEISSSTSNKRTPLTKMQQELGLSDEQVIRITPVYQEFSNKMKSARNSRDRGAMQSAISSYKQEMKQILTVEQFKKYSNIMAQKRSSSNRQRRQRGQRRF